MQKFSLFLLVTILLVIPLYPKFPLVAVTGSFVSVRLEDFLIALAVLVSLASQIKKRFPGLFAPQSRAVLLYLTVAFLAAFSGIFLTKTSQLNLGLLHTFRRVEYLSLFFVGLWSLRASANLSFIIRTILVGALLVGLYGLGQQFLGFPVISTTNSEFSKGLALQLGAGARINSTFAGHYDLAAFCIFPLLLIISLLPISKSRWLLLLVGAVVYWVLLLSASRISFASFFAAASLLVLFIRKPLWLAPLFVLAVFGFLASPQLRGRYLELLQNHLPTLSLTTSAYAQDEDPTSRDVQSEVPDALKPTAVAEDRSFNIRIQAEWPRALRAVAKNPLLGTGFSSVGLAVDNEFLRTAAETGILGLLAFLLIFLRFFRTSWPFIWHYSPSLEHNFIAAVTASLFGLLLTAIFIDIFSASKIAIYTWTLVGITQAVKQTTKV